MGVDRDVTDSLTPTMIPSHGEDTDGVAGREGEAEGDHVSDQPAVSLHPWNGEHLRGHAPDTQGHRLRLGGTWQAACSTSLAIVTRFLLPVKRAHAWRATPL